MVCTTIVNLDVFLFIFITKALIEIIRIDVVQEVKITLYAVILIVSFLLQTEWQRSY